MSILNSITRRLQAIGGGSVTGQQAHDAVSLHTALASQEVVLTDEATSGLGAPGSPLELRGSASGALINVTTSGTITGLALQPRLMVGNDQVHSHTLGVAPYVIDMATGEVITGHIEAAGRYWVPTNGAGRLYVQRNNVDGGGSVTISARATGPGLDPYTLRCLLAIESSIERVQRVTPRMTHRGGPLGAGVTETLMSTSKSCWIERFEIMANDELGGVRVTQDGVAWAMLSSTTSGTASSLALTIANVRDYGDAQFELTHESGSVWKMGLRDRVFVPAGNVPTELQVRNRAGSDIQLSAFIRITEVY